MPSLDRSRVPAAPSKEQFGLTKWLPAMGWRTVMGRVIAIDQPYQVARKTNWLLALPTLLVLLVALPLILGAIVATKISVSWFRGFQNIFQFRASDRNDKSGMGSQLLSFILYGSLFGPKKSDTIRDIRVRDDQGQEHLVRIVGDLVAGNVNVGDEIEAVGWDKRGTLIFYRGRNLRTNSDILNKRL